LRACLGAGGLARCKPRLDAGALVAAVAGVTQLKCKMVQRASAGPRRKGDGHVKPSKAMTGSVMISIVKYLHNKPASHCRRDGQHQHVHG
jgi:hypothetical protein